MKQSLFTVLSQTPLADGVFRLILAGDTGDVTAPGQFVNIRLDGFFLRRPISVCDADARTLTLIYKVVGGGTEALRGYGAGAELDLLTGLGNGYDTAPSGGTPLLLGGGVGTPPLYWLCKRLLSQGKRPRVVLGFNRGADVFYEEEFRALGVPVTVATADGSRGVGGFVTDAMGGAPYSYFYACGPEAMLQAVCGATETDGQLSFEARMGCGFGACMGCSCKTKYGSKRICRDGPVLKKGEVIW